MLLLNSHSWTVVSGRGGMEMLQLVHCRKFLERICAVSYGRIICGAEVWRGSNQLRLATI